MALDPASAELLDKARQNGVTPREQMTPGEARAATAAMRGAMGNGAELYRVEQIDVPVRNARLPARIYVPSQVQTALMVYFHGGGWVSGSLEEFDPLCRDLAAATGCALVSVQYRKAPEHRYPTPVDDAWDALCWIAAEQEALIGKQLPLVVGGDSAGANLAIAVALRARAAGGPRIAAQLLIYPVTDCAFDRPSYVDPDNQLMLTREAMIWYWDHYAPDEETRVNPEVSVLRASDFADLPPAVIVTAEHDVLRDEGEEFARCLAGAGVEVRHWRAQGQLHGFMMMVDILPGSAEGIEFVGNEMRRILHQLNVAPSQKGRAVGAASPLHLAYPQVE